MLDQIKFSRRVHLISLTCLSFMCANLYSAVPGPYFGLQVGWGGVHAGISRSDMHIAIARALGDKDTLLTSFNTGAYSNGMAGRIFAGFQFNCFFATEFGWSRFPHAPMRATATVLDGEISASDFTAGSIKTSALDLVAKGILPLPYFFNLYAKVGIAYVDNRSNESVTVEESGNIFIANYDNVTQRYFPTFGLGLSYDLTPSVIMDLAWNHIQKIGHVTDIGNTDLATFGLTYNFGSEWA